MLTLLLSFCNLKSSSGCCICGTLKDIEHDIMAISENRTTKQLDIDSNGRAKPYVGIYSVILNKIPPKYIRK